MEASWPFSPARTYVSPEEYLALERSSKGRKCEYIDGQIYAIAGVSCAHVTISMNLSVAISTRLRGTSCRAGVSDLRVRTPNTTTYTYPDLFVTCEKPRFDDDEFDVLLNPILILEILSPSTEAYDRGKKFDRYREIQSLKDYVLVSQDRAAVEVFERAESGWVFNSYSNTDSLVRLNSLNLQIPLAEVYEAVSFEDFRYSELP